MREIDLTYGSFELAKSKKDKKELILEENIKTINRHFDAKREIDDNISIVAEIDDEEKVIVEPDETEKEYSSGQKKSSIGGKLIFIISTLVIISMGLITYLVSYFVTADTKANAEASNFTLNSRTASDCENQINNIVSNVALFYNLINGTSQTAVSSDAENFNESKLTSAKEAIKFFELNPQIASVYFASSSDLIVNKEFSVANGIPESSFEAYFQSEEDSFNSAKNGLMKIQNASPFFSNAMLSVFFPVFVEDKPQVIAALFNAERLAENISTGKINESFFVNDKGIVLLHNDSNLMMTANDCSQNVFLKEILNSNSSGMQQSYVDTDGEEYFAACKKITNANCYVITQVKSSVVLAAIKATTKRNIALTIAILSIAILIIWIFAKTLSVPLEKLTAVTEEINKGNFNTDLFNRLNIK
ncbi:MAG: cache domain-containing protein [Treponema sp.]|nr:cache domain-containing protein [Candidatus Treponema merdequi]